MARFRAVGWTMILLAGLTAGSVAAQQAQTDRLRVFLDCEPCDFDYMRTELSWVDYVRDRTDADVHILVTTQSTGAGGREYVVTLIGLGALESKADTVRYASAPDDSRDMTRQGLTRTIAFALVPWIQGSPILSQMTIQYRGGDEEGGPAGRAGPDPWNFWVFEVSGEANGDGESLQSSQRYSLDLNANRTTDLWKVEIGASSNYRESQYEIDSVTTVTLIRKSYDGDFFAGRSVTPHWTLGLEGLLRSSTYGNVKWAYRIAPAVEYDIFPYSEYTRRGLTLQYSFGINTFHYNEITIFGRLHESRANHALAVAYNARQPWGSLGISVGAEQFLHDTRKYRASISAEGDIRLWKGLSLSFDGQYGRVRDQLSIPGRDATSDEILLEIRELQTNYSYEFGVGLSYRFGSIYNNIVNSRFRHGIAGGSQF